MTSGAADATRGGRGTPSPAGRTAPTGPAAFAAAWANRIMDSSYATPSQPEVEALLAGLTEKLRAALLADELSLAAGYDAGRALVWARFIDPDSLVRTIAVLGEELLPRLGIPDGPKVRARVSALQGAVAAGHSKTLRDRALTEHEEIVRAALVARTQAERLWRASEVRFQTVFAEAPLGILIGDLTGHILDANQALVDLLGYPLEELSRRQFTDFAHPQDGPTVWTGYEELLRGDRDVLRLDKPMTRRDGSALWTQLTMSLVRDDAGRRHRVVALFSDVTERHELVARLRHLATHDPLTGLPNRLLFMEALAAACATTDEHARLGLCFIDLDGFKVVNDTFGHHTGDRLLEQIAGRLGERVSALGHLVARLGGDEFVVLVDGSHGPKQVTELAEQVLAALEPPVRVDGHELCVSASIGVVERPAAGADPADVLRAADVTLYWAKADGKARWALFDPVRNAREVARHRLSTTMPAALTKGEFLINYQPVLRLSDGAVLGVEAQVQWRHPRAGLLGPDQFLDLAEESGLILALGRWALATACEQMRQWRELSGRGDLFVSVHIGSRQSRDPRLPDDVMRVLEGTGLTPGQLQLELTRGALADACEEPLRTLSALSGRGVRIALGDFGPGHGNLATLRGLAVHTLKIDRGFVRALDGPAHDALDEQIVTALVTLAHSLGLTVTAEGVETGGQLAKLLAVGCDNGQGRFMVPAGPPKHITRLLQLSTP